MNLNKTKLESVNCCKFFTDLHILMLSSPLTDWGEQSAEKLESWNIAVDCGYGAASDTQKRALPFWRTMQDPMLPKCHQMHYRDRLQFLPLRRALRTYYPRLTIGIGKYLRYYLACSAVYVSDSSRANYKNFPKIHSKLWRLHFQPFGSTPTTSSQAGR